MGTGVGWLMDTRQVGKGERMHKEGEKRIDLKIGERLSALRRLRRLSQKDLAAQSGISYQQVQKYEKGIDRIAASRLWTFSRVLDISPLYFFEGLYGCKGPGH